jgi:hypothetical protein
VVYSAAYPGNGARDESRLPRRLFIVVAVLGLAVYCVSFGSTDEAGLGWYGRFAAAAGLLAAFGVLAKHRAHATATAALAAMGFLDALHFAVTATDQGWALTVIVILTVLQAAAAVAALVLAPRAASGGPATEYEAYVDYYNQAVRNYYNQQAQSVPPEQVQRSGYGTAHADAQAAPQAQRAQRPSQQADYAELGDVNVRGSAAQNARATASGRPEGLPSFGQAQVSADQNQHRGGAAPPPSSPA